MTYKLMGNPFPEVTGEATAEVEPDRRVAEAECYVRTRFYPPLPYEYGEYAVQAVDACNEGEPEREIMLDPNLPMWPKAATFDESGSVSCSAEGLVDALRLWHMVDEEDEPHDCAENAVECGTGPNVSGVLHLWDECGVCGHQFNHRTDSVL